MYCPNCGARVDAGFRWCSECGMTLPSEMQRQPPPHLRRQPDEHSFNKIFMVTIMFVLLIFSAIFVYLLTAEPYPLSPDEEQLTVHLSFPLVYERAGSNQTCWDAMLTIERIHPKDERVLWPEVMILVKGADGMEMDAPTAILPDAGDYTDPPSTEFWYEDVDGDKRFSAGDTIRVTGMDIDYEAAHLQLRRVGRVIADVLFPTEFP